MAINFRSDGTGKILVHVTGLLMLFDAAESAGVKSDVVVGLLVLSNMLGGEVGVRQEARTNCLETCVGCREEDAGYVEDVAGVYLASKGALTVNSEGPGNMADRDLISHFLDLYFLER